MPIFRNASLAVCLQFPRVFPEHSDSEQARFSSNQPFFRDGKIEAVKFSGGQCRQILNHAEKSSRLPRRKYAVGQGLKLALVILTSERFCAQWMRVGYANF